MGGMTMFWRICRIASRNLALHVYAPLKASPPSICCRICFHLVAESAMTERQRLATNITFNISFDFM
jgi:hypothetical protein